MRSISDTIRRLSALRGKSNTPSKPRQSRLAEVFGFGSNPGTLRAWAYFPKDLPMGAPLVVVMHGCTQTAAGYDQGSGWSRLAEREGFGLLFPEQQRANNPNLCFNWFQPGDIQRDAGEALSVRQMIESVANSHGIDRGRIFITGLSAGGAMASVMLATYPELFAGGAIIAGLPYGIAATIPEAFDRMRGHAMPVERQLKALVRNASTHTGPWPTLSIWHGTSDRTVEPSNAEAIIEQWRSLHGVGALPTRTDIVNGYPRRIWRDHAGKEVIEAYSISGMGHGTPLDTSSAEGGEPGPFMLNVGISSTFHIARFWGLTRDAGVDAASFPHPSSSDPASRSMPLLAARRRADRQSATDGSDVAGIRKTIEDALRAAGLMK